MPETSPAPFAGTLPQPANAPPKAEMTGGATGSQSDRYALEDHQHPRLTSTTYATLDSSGTATVSFTRAFTNKPGLNLTEVDSAAGSQPLVLRGSSWVQDTSGKYIGVTIIGSRARFLPTINPLSGTLSLLTSVVSGVNSVFATLTHYDIFGGSASGASVSVIAVARSDVAAT